ncbi:PREDICTED: nucleolar complex protein 2 homolog [Tarenaya hassleriana]|uniref:nucleolar complex protein 2 homolog n=1 Tax=Tarenaya hassleriana TaxID=28532 RepID=UPI00053C29AD|nr:PREDICTED: nucleolar complex protein 2 homolog [Tarenaya hassleriana]XP_010557884.1 PREDICTED: nucleolar complex protein 2 homolog [Tarenaya hassleriana]
MGKLGKKARKFAKKNLQSVLKRKRKLKSFFKRKEAKRDERQEVEDEEGNKIEQQNKRNHEEDAQDISIDAVFSEDDDEVLSDDSDSDGYLSEDTGFADATEKEKDCSVEGSIHDNAWSVQSKEMVSDLKKKRNKLDRLKQKDPKFAKFLKTYSEGIRQSRHEDDYLDEDEAIDDPMQLVDETHSDIMKRKLFTGSILSSCCDLLEKQQSVHALASLLNGYRAACHYGNEPSGLFEAGVGYDIGDSETFSKILIFVLQKADSTFRSMLGIAGPSNKEKILKLKNTPKWDNLKPLIKSYLRSTSYFLNQASDSEMLVFALTQLRASIPFFAAFPNLLQHLIKTAVHLWLTGEGTLSQQSFLIIKDVAMIFNSDCFDACLVNMYKAFLRDCNFSEAVSSKHLLFLRDSLVELCSQDVQKSYTKASISIMQLAKLLKVALRTKKKETVEKIYGWQYTNCVDLWVNFIAANIRDCDLQPLLHTMIQIINGVARLFPGPRYLPLRIRCIKWLNHLSSASGIFIPVASLVLDILEYKITKDREKQEKELEVLSSVKLPKNWLKSRNFQEQCISSVIGLLAVHFAQWSFHISFPELATIPVMALKKFIENTTATPNEGTRRGVKRFIEHVEENIKFVQSKREEAAFSPKDHQSVETFLQLEKHKSNARYTQYYKSIIEKAAA